MRWGVWLSGGALIVVGSVASCVKLPGEPISFDGEGGFFGNPVPEGQGVGEDCSSLLCRPGLRCSEAQICEPGRSLPLGSRCLIGVECEAGLACVAGACVSAGEGALGADCTADTDCGAELRCGFAGLRSVCTRAGTGDLEAKCESQSDCFQGLYCGEGRCVPPERPWGFPLWRGVSCEKPNDDEVQALFSVPGATGTPKNADFFQLPYPNDIRLSEAGRPVLDGFPTPGPYLLGVDLVQRYVDAVSRNTQGWSAATSVLFRFSGALDFASLSTPEGEARRMVLVDLDDPNGAIDRLGLNWSFGSGKTRYVCDNWLSVGLGTGGTLVPGHRHAVWVTTDARSKKSKSIARSPQFAALLEGARPQDPALHRAYERYAPLRAYLTKHEVAPESLLVASVFTVGDPIEPMRKLAAQVESEATPSAEGWVRCAKGDESPCAQAEGARACGAGTADYEEYQALVSLPIFQEGEPPYGEEGGGISARRVRREEVCLSLTVPKAEMPTAGWPLVVSGHGTGGSMRSHVRDEIAGELARATPAFAVLGIDQVQHGPRRGSSNEDPETLFFNFMNPDAARGNPLQGAADQLSLLRFAEQLDLGAAETGGRAIRIDPEKIYSFGHSQGATHASLALPFSTYPGAVLSGNGAGLALALLNKTEPVDLARVIPFALQDPDARGKLHLGVNHPALGLLQHYMDAGDPLHFAPLLTRRPEPDSKQPHVFQLFGVSDSYSPPITLSAFIYSAGELMLAPPPSGLEVSGDNRLALPNSLRANAPVHENFVRGVAPSQERYTLVTRQYAPPSGKDGHFVAFDVAEARADVTGFFQALGSGDAPTVPAP